MRAHTAWAKREGITDEQIAALKEPGGCKPPLYTPGELAALHYADLMTRWPASIGEVELEALAKHFTDEQIVELGLAIVVPNITNRLNEGWRTPLDV